jgi:hypothetical protein
VSAETKPEEVLKRTIYWRDLYQEAAEQAERDGQDSMFERSRANFLTRLILGDVEAAGANEPGSGPIRSTLLGKSGRAASAAPAYETENAVLEEGRELRGHPETECPECGLADLGSEALREHWQEWHEDEYSPNWRPV